MGLNSKKQKVIEELSERPSEDRISSLPNTIIGNILSRIATKDAVATSVLSTRWKHCWRSITSLYFDDNLLLDIQNTETVQRLLAQFISFVYRVLLLGRFSSIEKFHLHCCEIFSYACVNTWLTSALKFNFQELDVSVPFKDCVLLPRNLFTCRSLVKLKLHGEVVMSVPDTVSLPCVKSVDLTLVKFLDDDSIARFLSGCPVLDSLKMRRCVVSTVEVIKVSVPTLTSLSLSILHHAEDFVQHTLDIDVLRLRIVLETPLLSHISIKDFVAEGYVLDNLHKLASARIATYSPLGRDTKTMLPFEDIHLVAVNDLLKGISKVKELFFYTQGIDMSQLPTFENLTDLRFDACRGFPLELLPEMLHRSPQLCSLRLTFDHENGTTDVNEDHEGTFDVDPSEGTPSCCMFHLRIIEIVNFRASNKEVELVEYFLKNAEILEKLTVRCRSQEALKVSELLMVLPRASRSSQVEFFVDADNLRRIPSFSIL